MRKPLDDDPLAAVLAPPLGETPQDRKIRETFEAQARMISEGIDEHIKNEQMALRKKKRPIKVLLLGQSESGKSATLKNFQLMYARQQWVEQREAWKAVIQLNLVRNVNDIMDVLVEEMSARRTPSSSRHKEGLSTSLSVRFTETHRLLELRLGPLRRIQMDLERQLGPASTEIQCTSETTAAPFEYPSKGRTRPTEFCINSSNGWKTALDRFRSIRAPDAPKRRRNAGVDEITEVISGCRDDMKAIWEDPTIQSILSRRKSRMEDTPGFFLNDVERIASRNYQPNDEDIIRARLRTLGVQEYKFTFENGWRAGQEWYMYDVGGTRSSRGVWYPYFDDMNAIIFLAPISCFDEQLAEDRRVNRLEDSYSLWRAVCACKLLANTQLILFLNKCDLFAAKLERGVRIKDTVPSYGQRRNDLPTAAKYFQQRFKEALRQHSPVSRPSHIHLTSVINTRSTSITLGLVEQNIIRDHLRNAVLM